MLLLGAVALVVAFPGTGLGQPSPCGMPWPVLSSPPPVAPLSGETAASGGQPHVRLFETGPDECGGHDLGLAVRRPEASRVQAGARVESTYDRIWKFANWYEDESAPIVQRVLFSGRFQHEYAWIDADQGSVSEWNVRRLRLGPRVTLFRRVLFHAEVELNPQEHDPLYMRFTDFYVQWTRSSRFALTVGKQGVPFTVDGATSSKELLTIDRSNLSNNIWFPQEYMPGVSVSGRASPWIYRAGLYSAGASNREFGNFSGGPFGLGVIGYDFARSAGMKEAVVTANYLYQDADRDNTFTRQLEQVASLNLRLEDERWGLRTDVSYAAGYLGQPDLWGLMAMPFVNVTDRLQVVGRYTRLTSDGTNGVRLATYESRLVSGRGDRYDEAYAGVNYYFYGHKLKLQSGLQFVEMDDRAADGGAFSGTAWTTGLRVGW
jgi:phosphate-selective porin OprO/OprP